MTDIFFKAKRKDNREWEYGNYLSGIYRDKNGKEEIKGFILPGGTRLTDGAKFKDLFVEVEMISVCQYSLLDDMRIDNIFDGDILREKKNGFIGVCEFEDGEFKVKWRGRSFLRSDLKYWCEQEQIEVIGNIFDESEVSK